MKTKKLIFSLSMVLLVSFFGFGQGITNSAHDFANESWNSTGEICKVCHTPHNAVVEPNAPLWNHDLSTATYTIYDTAYSSTFNAVASQPAGTSKLCLSCHDGTVALNAFGGGTGSNVFLEPGDDAYTGTELQYHHPISFTYDDALLTAPGQTSSLHTPSTAPSGLGGTIQTDLLFADRMQCASCHDVHNAAGNPGLLRVNNAGSTLCLTCHNM